MGSCESWVFPNGFVLNGLLPDKPQSVTQALDRDRWLLAEKRIALLITHIQPNESSEKFRHAVTCYVKGLIMKCFSCQVFVYGSVPLKTYLPEGDVDLTIYSEDQKLKDTWADEVKGMLENAQKNKDAEFHIKEIQYIQAEVKIIKCLVENIQVDISFNQRGGLRTLSFIEAVDSLINQNHLFKRSLILTKAWCYYESHTLGANRRLISTYALEVLVLYIFHVFNSSFAGPLEVLFRFLEFFHKFDWNGYALGLWGPVPLGLIHEMRVEPPRKDRMNLLLSRPLHDACLTASALMPDSFDLQEQQFITKHLNIVDPLRNSNNLGRSVSKGSFFNIISAFTFGAKQLARLLDCPSKNLIEEVDLFFKNTWHMHGKENDPNAVINDLFQLIDMDQSESEHWENYSNHERVIENSEQLKSNRGVTPPVDTPNDISACHDNCSPGDMLSAANESAFLLPMNQKITRGSYYPFYPLRLQVPLQIMPPPFPWNVPCSFQTNKNPMIQRPQVAVIPTQPYHGYYQVEKDSTRTKREDLWQYGKPWISNNNPCYSPYGSTIFSSSVHPKTANPGDLSPTALPFPSFALNGSTIFPSNVHPKTANPDDLSPTGPPFPPYGLPYLQGATMIYEYPWNWRDFKTPQPVPFTGTIEETHQVRSLPEDVNELQYSETSTVSSPEQPSSPTFHSVVISRGEKIPASAPSQ